MSSLLTSNPSPNSAERVSKAYLSSTHAPVTDMIQATIPSPQNSSLQPLDPCLESKEQKSGP